MRSRSLAVLAVLIAATPSLAAEALRASGRIDAVTVYRGQAQVTRTLEVSGPVGTREIIFTDLPARVSTGSLVAEGEGLEVRSVLYRETAAEADIRAEVRALDGQIRTVQDTLARLGHGLQVLQDHKAYLAKLENFVAPTATTELSKGVLNADTLSKLSTYLLDERKRVSEEELKIGREQRDANEGLELLKRKRGELSAGAAKTLREAVVLLETRAPKATLRLQYLVDGATWTPSYNVKDVAGDPSKLAVDYNASIRQQSGEDWPDVRMRLSTATPSLVALPPSLEPLFLTLSAQARQEAALGDYGRAKSELKSQARGLEAARNSAPAASGIAQKAERDLNEIANRLQVLDLLARDAEIRAGAGREGREEEIAVTYDLPATTTLPSRSDLQLVQIASLSLPASRVKVATPLLTAYVYEQAEVKNDSSTVLLAGEMVSFARGQFVGRGAIPTVAPGQTFTAGLGIDPSLRASRELIDKKETLSGGNKVTVFSYRLRLVNYAAAPAAVRLLDRLPTAKETAAGGATIALTGTSIPLSADSEYAAADAKHGILRWDLTAPPFAVGAKAFEVSYTYRIEHDRQLSLTASVVEP